MLKNLYNIFVFMCNNRYFNLNLILQFNSMDKQNYFKEIYSHTNNNKSLKIAEYW